MVKQRQNNRLTKPTRFSEKLSICWDFAKKCFKKPETFFLIFSITFGFMLVFVTPPMQVPDANSHFIRAYQVSDLNLTSTKFIKDNKIHYGSEIPVSVIEARDVFLGGVIGQPQNQFKRHIIKQYVNQPLNPNIKEKTIIEAAGVYSPLVYIPQAVGISIGKIFQTSPLIMIWLARLMNLAVWIVAIYFAIRLLPFAKWGLVILALNPVAVFFSASVSPDVINISFAFLFVSMILSTFGTNKLATKKKLLMMLILLGVLALSKPVNVLFAPLLFTIPGRHFATRRKYLFYCIGGFLLSILLFILWNYQIRGILDASVLAQSGGANISVHKQLAFVVHHPFGYVKTIVNNFIIVSPGTSGDAVLGTYFGVLGWLDTTIPLWSIMLYLLTLGLAVLNQFGRGIVVLTKHKLIFLSIFAIAFVGNITAMYFNATIVGSPVVSGVQGRYFMPFTILLLVVFTGRKKVLQISNKNMSLILGLSMSVVLIMTVIRICMRYYGIPL